MGFDEGVDVGFQFCGGTVYAALQLLSRQLCKPPLDLIDPGCRRWREVNMQCGRRASQALILGVLWAA